MTRVCKNRPFPLILMIIAILALLLPGKSTADRRSKTDFSQYTDQRASEFVDTENKADVLSLVWSRQELTQAAETLVELAADWGKLEDYHKSARCLRKAGKLYLILGDMPHAERLFVRSKRIASGIKDSREISLNLSELFGLAADRGDIKVAKRLLDRALKYADASGEIEVQAVANSIAGDYYDSVNDNGSAIKFYSGAINLWKASGNTREKANTELKLGYEFLKNNDYSLALQAINSSYENLTNANDLRGRAFALKALGTFFSLTGENQKALEAYRQAESYFPEDLDNFEKAGLFFSIGFVYENYGDWRQSFANRLKALELSENDGNTTVKTMALTSLGKLSNLLDDDHSALLYLNRAKTLAVNANDRLFIAITNEELGNLYLKQKSYPIALTFYQNALVFLRLDYNQRQIARVYLKIGQVHENQNQFALAAKYYNGSLRLNHTVKDSFAEAETVFHLAKLECIANNQERAFNLAKQSVEITENLTSGIIHANLKKTYFSNIFDRYELYTSLLIWMDRQNGGKAYASQAMQTAERSRARAMLENLSLSEANFVKDASPEILEREKGIRVQLNTKSDKLSELLSGNGDKVEVKKREDEIGELENQLEEIKAELKQKSPIYSAIKNPEPFDVGEFQANTLDMNSVLLEFSLGKDESYLWVVGKTEVDSYVLPARERIEGQVDNLRALLKDREMLAGESVEEYQKRLADAETEYLQEARILSSELLGQAADKMQGKRLIVVADGKLNLFPLAALPMPNVESNDPILLTNEVVYEPSASALRIIASSAAGAVRPQKDLLVFADPVFSKSDDRLTGLNTKQGLVSTILGRFWSGESLDSLSRLPASADEAKSISEVVGASNTTIRSGFEANRESALNSEITDYKMLHFATHGLIDERRPELSGILLSLYGEDGSPQDGGFIRLQDVYGLNLNTDLVVLSACDTGIGKEIKGEGLMSLNNAFLQAGAKSVVSSLWKVDDNATKELMTEFYRGMAADDLTASAALRQAQIKMRGDPRFNSPFFWASFTAHGDFMNPPNLRHPFDRRILALGIAPILVFSFYLKRRRAKRMNRES